MQMYFGEMNIYFVIYHMNFYFSNISATLPIQRYFNLNNLSCAFCT